MLILDAHLPPGLAAGVAELVGISCYPATYLGLCEAYDIEIFELARQKNAIVITKDDDSVKLLHRFGSPPKTIWLTCGNTSKARLKIIFKQYLPVALHLLENDDLVEISG